MAVEIVGRHVSITDSMRDYARKRLDKIVAEFESVDHIHVIMDIQKYLNRVDITAHARRHVMIEAHAESEDMYGSVDLAIDRLHAQLRRTVDKRNEHKAHASAAEFEQAVVPDDGHG